MYWLYLAPILEFSHQKTLTKNNEKTKLPPSTHRTVFSANSSATPALRGNEVSMDTIDLGNSESLVSLMFTSESMAEQKNKNAPLFFNLKCQRE